MTDACLASLAQAVGIHLDWTSADHQPQRVSPEVQRALLEALGFPAQSPEQIARSLAEVRHRQAAPPALLTVDRGAPLDLDDRFLGDSPFQLQLEDGSRIDGRLDDQGRLPPQQQCGYHQLRIGDAQLALAVTPPRCPTVAELCGGRQRVWGLAAQVYSLRREHDGGLGDLGALQDLLRSAARHGADALAISPLHAMFAAARQAYSPYSPSSRLFFNELHAAPEDLFGAAAVQRAIASCGLAEEMRRLESLALIDWPAVSVVRERLLRQLHMEFRHGPEELQQDFAQFRVQGGEALMHHCAFQVLQERRRAAGDGLDWRNWPAEYQTPYSPLVQSFIAAEEAEIGYQLFAQWLAARSLHRAQRVGREAGMGIGLIADLAVGADPAGSQAWSRQDELLSGVSVGAPPDILNRSGQSWGLSAFSPDGLRRHGFRGFIEMLRANLAHVGGLRIDHAIGLRRLWLIPRGASAEAGAYLEYPMHDLLRLICLEASRARALIIGEDLGTIPEGLRETLAWRGILGTRVLLFEQHGGHFIAPQHWSAEALATSTTHDLPPLEGWLRGRDIEWRELSNHYAPEVAAGERHLREAERHGLLAALRGYQGEHDGPVEAAAGFLGATPAPLVLLPLEDALASDEQPNLPGPGDTHPNWRRRWPTPAAQMLDSPEVAARLQRLDAARRHAEPRHD
ncbi:4-alpha-glucanotransferase [Pseudomonas jinjuensis]|uniref:4-alpha-glucanotransferase n=1 Tax=Pseudomonas jinjuensis TaxID=198616 RepID=A0A1H0CYL3_9PSED|nr:4-alpha-glucanotransferase [Pseudomonas jinjuensis]SDN63000.1 4-alpha-glucanotransferase [Pseudomonas jinjuensis]